ncbi:tail fiber protein [Pseudomonas phage PSP30]|nr:tail fiber protein [Pseudomonas phage PSP30]
MGLEVATYIDQLVPTNPTGSDLKSFGDDHIRLIKSAIKNTFPSINQAVTVTAAQLNSVADTTQYVKPGMVIMWAGTLAQIPAGWKLCNGVGTTSNGIPVPNLIGAFPWGIDGTSQTVGTRGGNANIVWEGLTEGHALTLAQIPAHTHTWRTRGATTLTGSAGDSGALTGGSGNAANTNLETGSAGQGQAHTHAVKINMPFGNIPPFCAVFFIIKN